MADKPAVVCVFCGSTEGKSSVHAEAARSLAKALHENNVKLVYGGGTVGLMGEVARTLVSLSGPDSVHGVIPSALLPLEAKRRGEDEDPKAGETSSSAARATSLRNIFGQTTIVPDMHSRKRLMADLVSQGGPGSGFIALSGGFGTIEELMEITTWNQLGIHDLGVVAYNVDGYWDGLCKWIRDAVTAGFILRNNADILVEATSADGCIQALKNYSVSRGRYGLKWTDEKQ